MECLDYLILSKHEHILIRTNWLPEQLAMIYATSCWNCRSVFSPFFSHILTCNIIYSIHYTSKLKYTYTLGSKDWLNELVQAKIRIPASKHEITSLNSQFKEFSKYSKETR